MKRSFFDGFNRPTPKPATAPKPDLSKVRVVDPSEFHHAKEQDAARLAAEPQIEDPNRRATPIHSDHPAGDLVPRLRDRVDQVLDSFTAGPGVDGDDQRLTKEEARLVLEAAIDVLNQDYEREYGPERAGVQVHTDNGAHQTGSVLPWNDTFDVSFFAGPSPKGIDGGRIAYLSVRDSEGDQIAGFEDGAWTRKPEAGSMEDITTECVVSFYQDHTRDQMPEPEHDDHDHGFSLDEDEGRGF